MGVPEPSSVGVTVRDGLIHLSTFGEFEGQRAHCVTSFAADVGMRLCDALNAALPFAVQVRGGAPVIAFVVAPKE
jgi:hypothetical protein